MSAITINSPAAVATEVDLGFVAEVTRDIEAIRQRVNRDESVGEELNSLREKFQALIKEQEGADG